MTPIATGLARPRPARYAHAIARGVVLLDAGMGTRLIARGLDLRSDDPCLWNLDRPDEVLDVHRCDVVAGSMAVLTNTFGANRAWLARLGRRHDVEAVNRAAVALARRAVGTSGFVIGDIGPTTADERGAAAEQAAVLVEAGVDALILETFASDQAISALAELRSGLEDVSVPVIVGLWRWPDAVEDAARRLVDAGASAIGINCRPALDAVGPIVGRLAQAVACPLLVKPGIAPDDDADRSSPSAFAAAVPALLKLGVRLIGGCCGTTDAHIAALAAACSASPLSPNAPCRGTAP